MLENGYIKIHRKLCNWRWFKDDNTFRVFMYILLQANYEPHDFENITVDRGQFVTSYPNLSFGTGLTIRQVRTAINHLISTGEVTASKYPKYTVYTVVNYDEYQDNRQANRQSDGRVMTGHRHGSDSQLTTMEERRRKNKKDKKSSSMSVTEKNLISDDEYADLLKLTDGKKLNKYIDKVNKWQNRNNKKINNPFETIKKWIVEDNKNENKNQKTVNVKNPHTSYDIKESEDYFRDFRLYDEEDNN